MCCTRIVNFPCILHAQSAIRTCTNITYSYAVVQYSIIDQQLKWTMYYCIVIIYACMFIVHCIVYSCTLHVLLAIMLLFIVDIEIGF